MSAESIPGPWYWTVLALASKANVSRGTIYNLCRSGQLNAIRVGNCWRIPSDRAEALLHGEL